MNPIKFFAQGEPKGQPRARAFAFHGKARMYDPATAEGWKSCVAQAARPFLPAVPHSGPLSVSLLFVMPRPSAHYGSGKNSGVVKPTAPVWFCKKPDRDNLDKAVLDALTTLGMWQDDCQVVDGRIVKRFQRDRSEKCGVYVDIKDAVMTIAAWEAA